MNRGIKIGFSLMAVAVIVPVVADMIIYRKLMCSEFDERYANVRAARAADAVVKDLIDLGYYDDLPDTAAREKALKDDYEFFKMAARFKD
jgi:hypothetical protein